MKSGPVEAAFRFPLPPKGTAWRPASGFATLSIVSVQLLPNPLWPDSSKLTSELARRRSRCGSVRGRPVLSSHFSPGFAPHVGQRTDRAGFFLAFMDYTMGRRSPTKWSIVTSPQLYFR